MSNTSEGIVVPQENEKDIATFFCLQTLPQISRQLFVNDIQNAIGNLEDPYLPFSLKPILNQLLVACPLFVEEGNACQFFALCHQAIEICGKGWSNLSYWISSEQSRCYALFWRLKIALEKHQHHMTMFHDSKNDEELKQVYQIIFSNRQK